MHDVNFIVREPLLDTQERVLGFEFSWQGKGLTPGRMTDVEAGELADFVTDRITPTESSVMLDGRQLFLEASPAMLKREAYFRLPPQGKVLALRAEDLADLETVMAIRSLRMQDYGVALRGAHADKVDRSQLYLFSHVEIPIDAEDLEYQLDVYRKNCDPTTRMVATNIKTWDQYRKAAALKMEAFGGRLTIAPRKRETGWKLSPAQSMIIQLMDMVKQSASISQLEQIFKRDAALSYRLLRYINSAGYGLGCEIQSLRHAVTMMGYSPLYRWLAVLLATSSSNGYSSVLMQTAAIRGRFAELLGIGFLPKSEADNLFVAGMFSMLDQLLDIPMEDILEKIQLADSITEALLGRNGIYGPFLALAEACEQTTTDVASMATNLCVGADQVNDSHMAALAWTHRIKF
jgi:EAL and modified HD-GYP domain-containing signal transduction protein